MIVQHCPSCRESRLQTGDGDIPLDLSTATRIACEGEVVHIETISEKSHRKAPDEDRDQGESARALVSHPAIDRPTPPALRRKILARDGYRCRHCGKRGRLHAHHLELRSQNGPTVESNLAPLCDRCHGLVHDGLLFVTGDPEDELVFRDTRGEIIEVARPPLGCGALLLSLRSGGGKEFFGEDPGPEPDIARVDAGTPADSASAEGDANCKDSARAESRSENGPEGSTAVCQEQANLPPRIEDIPAAVSRKWWRKNRHFFKCTGVGRNTIAER